jgi:hypothetical protein
MYVDAPQERQGPFGETSHAIVSARTVATGSVGQFRFASRPFYAKKAQSTVTLKGESNLLNEGIAH